VESPGRKTRDEWRVIDVVGMAVAIVASISALIALRDKSQILMTGVISGVLLGVIALLAFRRNDGATGRTVGGVAAIVLLATTVYGVFVDTSAAEAGTPKPVATTSPSPEPTPPRRSEHTPSAPAKEPPVYRGTAKLAAGQAVDLETPNPEPKRSSGFETPADVYIDSLSFVYDQGGYLLLYAGDLSDGEKGCRELLAEGASRTPIAPVPFAHYCVLTSENRVGLVQFTLSTTTYRAGGISYQVWD